ncbi:MAG TPA: RNA polymerase [Microscillaceae bacterium]|nr:RNA polymerase [Microscillaceae bacterium]
MKNDQLFWQKLVQGDKKVVEEIFQLNVPVLFKYGRRFSDDDRVIDECILHVFLDIWKNRLHLKEGQKEEGQIKLFLMKKLRQKLESKEQGTQLRRA